MTTTWRKARASNGANNCLEVYGNLTKVRDSKRGDRGPALRVDVRELTAAVKAGRLG